MVYKFFDKKLLVEQLKMKLYPIKNWQKNYTNLYLENLIKEKYTHLKQEAVAQKNIEIVVLLKYLSNFEEHLKFLLLIVELVFI